MLDSYSLLFLGGMLAVMYFFFIRPQSKQAKLAKDFQAGLEKGARVVTTGGVHGRIVKVDDTSVLLEIDNNVKIRLEKSAISMETSTLVYGADAEKKTETPATK